MSQVSSPAAVTNDNEVQISSGGDSSHGVNKRKRKSEIWKHFKDAEEEFIRCVYYKK
jgi:hypothetical protein